MREVFGVWRYTRMIVLVAITAALYAAVLIPFKPIPLIPGFTEVRPANAIPIVCSFLFGPAACWGSAFGNLIGDVVGGTLGLGSIFGFVGNFLYGLIPYKLWGRLGPLSSGGQPTMRRGREIGEYLFIALVSSLACGVTIGWGVDLLGMVPFAVLANIIWVNNFIVAAVLGPILLAVIYPRMARWGLLYTEIMDKGDLVRGRLSGLAPPLLLLGVFSGIAGGNLIAFRHWPIGLPLGLFPLVVLVLIGSSLL